MDDLAAAMRWISGNRRLLGFDKPPEVYLMGHSSGAHIALLFLILRAKTKESAAEDGMVATETTNTDADTESDNAADGGGQVEVEGFVGLSGVYDVHRHYLYESWR